MKEKPSYYAIIPANVRYDSELKANEKLLYGEISSLCNKDGTCWASNRYFSELYEVDIATISRWINNLINKKYLNVMYGKDNQRILSIDNNTLLIKKSIPIDEKINTPIDEKVKHNNINNNNKNNNIDLLDNNKGEEVFDYYQQEIGQLTPKQYEVLNTYIDKLDPLLIKEGINITVDSGVKTMNYLKAVLNNFIAKGYKCITDLETPVRTDKNSELEEDIELFDYDWLNDKEN